MQKVAKFEKVSLEQFRKDFNDCFPNIFTDDEVVKFYDNIKLPKRGTTMSAGYDFFAFMPLVIDSGETVKFPTGIRVKMLDGWVLKCYPRSGLGAKYRMQLDYTVGIIDADYYFSKNEGHIYAKFTNDSKDNKTVRVNVGQGYMQGVFVPFGITEDDDVTEIRDGGFGSTTK